MREHRDAVFGDVCIGLDVPEAQFAHGGKGLDRVFRVFVSAAAMGDDQRLITVFVDAHVLKLAAHFRDINSSVVLQELERGD